MPNGNHDFDLAVEERWFSSLARMIDAYAREHNLLIDKYYHESATWSLRFKNPRGGVASVGITHESDGVASISAAWYIDDYDTFTRFLHLRPTQLVPKREASVREALDAEFRAILAVPTGMWTSVVPGFESSWGKYAKAQLSPGYPDPVNYLPLD